MINTPSMSNNWKKEQIEYFKKYLMEFSSDSREYSLIKSGIERLEKSL